MDILIIGTMNNYLKMQSLSIKWALKQKGIDPDDPNRALKESAAQQLDAAKLSGITTKLKMGKRLNTNELAYLKDHAPALYNKAVAIQKEREGYERRLSKCRTKEEVDRLRDETLQQFCKEAQTITRSSMPAGEKLEQMEFLEMRMRALEDSHRTFRASREYRELPEEKEEHGEKKRLRREA